jgi:S1-C subfamily serine protease
MAPAGAGAQARGIGQISGDAGSLEPHSGSQGYLGVDLADVDSQEAKELNLKVAGGAVITLIDHDAPAGQVGLRVKDVVVGLNGETVVNAAGLRRMLRDIPADRTVSLEFSRDGSIQTVAVKLADRGAIEREVWRKIDGSEEMSAPAPGMGVVSGGSASSPSGGFHFPFFGASPNVGALVEPLTAQMAQSLGVRGGLMVKQVARQSAAAAAGMKVFDVILQVGPNAVFKMADWERALRANQGKPVQLVVLRDRKQQTVTLHVDSKRHS